jgi:hypothetical protein
VNTVPDSSTSSLRGMHSRRAGFPNDCKYRASYSTINIQVSYDKLGVDSFGNPAGAMLSRAIGIKSNDCHAINCYSEETVTQVDYMTNILALTFL